MSSLDPAPGAEDPSANRDAFPLRAMPRVPGAQGDLLLLLARKATEMQTRASDLSVALLRRAVAGGRDVPVMDLTAEIEALREDSALILQVAMEVLGRSVERGEATNAEYVQIDEVPPASQAPGPASRLSPGTPPDSPDTPEGPAGPPPRHDPPGGPPPPPPSPSPAPHAAKSPGEAPPADSPARGPHVAHAAAPSPSAPAADVPTVQTLDLEQEPELESVARQPAGVPLPIRVARRVKEILWHMRSAVGANAPHFREVAHLRVMTVRLGMAGVLVLAVSLALLLTPLPELFGVQLFAVQGGSMEPTIPLGSAIVVRPVAARDLQVGDVITFADRGAPDTRVTHRIVSLEERNGQQTAITKGDANATTDSWNVPLEQAIGRVAFHVPYAGYAMVWLASPPARLAALLVVLVVLAAPSVVRAILRLGSVPRPQRQVEPAKSFDDLAREIDALLVDGSPTAPLLVGPAGDAGPVPVSAEAPATGSTPAKTRSGKSHRRSR